jgi:hypothetical protein
MGVGGEHAAIMAAFLDLKPINGRATFRFWRSTYSNQLTKSKKNHKLQQQKKN